MLKGLLGEKCLSVTSMWSYIEGALLFVIQNRNLPIVDLKFAQSKLFLRLPLGSTEVGACDGLRAPAWPSDR